MNIYVASSWREPRHPLVVAALEKAGQEVYNFREPEPGEKGFSWADIDPEWKQWRAGDFKRALNHHLASRCYRFDLNAMLKADACVLVVPETPGKSSHLELGFCAGAGKQTCVLLAEHGEPELTYKVANHIATTIDEVVKWATQTDYYFTQVRSSR